MVRRSAVLAALIVLLAYQAGAVPQAFSDDFDRESLGPDWVVDNGSFMIVADTLGEVSGVKHLDAKMRYVAGTTETADQFGKLQILAAGTDSFGFMFRAASSPGDNYEVHLPIGTSGWRWERYDPGYAERMGDCIGDANLANGDWIGASIEGGGPATVVSVYRWDTDPDAGGPVDITSNWGAPDCIMTGAAGPTFVDAGDHVGVRANTRSKTAPAFSDNWFGGDLSAARAVCGDGVIEAGETCDDGNTLPGDGCRADCTLELCQDGIVDPGEECDDGNATPGDGCRADCTAEVCGDLILDPGEECDDGNNLPGDGCDAGCLLEPPASCGDGVVDTELGEECDDGNNVPGDGCRADCTAEVCGDLILDPLEECDDGNVVPGDGCRADCTAEVCGDGFFDPPLEECDDGNVLPGDGCRSDCTAEVCGDGLLDPPLEECDDGNNLPGDGCDAGCLLEPPPATCGDGVLDTGLGEECDDGNTVPGDGCRANCTIEMCGDLILDPQEECDDGNNVPGDGCRADCTAEVCGDLILDPGEECEIDADCTAGWTCAGCGCSPPGSLFTDDFDRASLGPDWFVDSGSFSIAGNTLVENSGQRHTNTRLVYWAGTTATPDQIGKLQIVDGSSRVFGLLFRSGAVPGDHYQVHLPKGTSEWRWERYDPGFVERMSDCIGDGPVSNGDWIGATITGAGAATVVEVFRWSLDPDAGGPLDRTSNWGTPDCIMTGAAAGPTYVDAGDHVGIRSYTGTSSQSGSADSWSGGDLITNIGTCGDGILEGIEECDDGNTVPGDGCRADCTAEVCGDGLTDPPLEDCDDGNNVPGDGCRADCSAEVCGDGLLDPPLEDCDDGNNVPGDGCRADCSAEVCGDGLLDPPLEDCDDGNGLPGDGCRGDCTIESCGDLILDPGEECDDGNNDPGDGCDASCFIEPPPGCGDGVLDPGEACDDGNNVPGDGCRADCTIEVCGDGFLDPPLEECDDGNNDPGDGCRADCTAEVCGDLILDPGEQCEVDADCSVGEVCGACTCSAPGLGFFDDFDRASLGPDWVVDAGSFGVSLNRLQETTSQKFTNGQLRYVGGTTASPDQYGKLQIVEAQGKSLGFSFRGGASAGDHYQVHAQPGTNEWRWERYDPGFAERMGTCFGVSSVGDGDWIGAVMTGSGTATEVFVWRWDADPDLGGPVDVLGSWGVPDCVISGAAGPTFVDSGGHVGIRAYSVSSSRVASLDDWSAGDFQGDPDQIPGAAIELILDSSGAGPSSSLRDPDGIVVDSAGNVYVGACGSGPNDEGVWKVEPSGTVTKILGNEGDGTNNASCIVGLALDSAENLYAAGFFSDNVFRITPGGSVTEVIPSSGSGPGGALQGAIDVAVDGSDQVYVTGHFSHNVLVLRNDSSIDEILDASDGLLNPFGVVADASDTVFVAGFGSDEVYRITSAGSVSVILDSNGGGAPGGLLAPHDLALDASGNLYITGNASDNVLKRTPGGSVSEIADLSGDGAGNAMDNPTGIAVDANGNVYVAAFFSDNLFQITPGGTITQLIDVTGDGVNGYVGPSDFCVAVDAAGNVFTTGTLVDNTFRITPP